MKYSAEDNREWVRSRIAAAGLTEVIEFQAELIFESRLELELWTQT